MYSHMKTLAESMALTRVSVPSTGRAKLSKTTNVFFWIFPCISPITFKSHPPMHSRSQAVRNASPQGCHQIWHAWPSSVKPGPKFSHLARDRRVRGRHRFGGRVLFKVMRVVAPGALATNGLFLRRVVSIKGVAIFRRRDTVLQLPTESRLRCVHFA